MVVTKFGILQLGCCWHIISPMIELVVFIESKLPSVRVDQYPSFEADESMHPV